VLTAIPSNLPTPPLLWSAPPRLPTTSGKWHFQTQWISRRTASSSYCQK
jgi:hypothetical protein